MKKSLLGIWLFVYAILGPVIAAPSDMTLAGVTDQYNILRQSTAEVHWHLVFDGLEEYAGARTILGITNPAGLVGLYQRACTVDPVRENELYPPIHFSAGMAPAEWRINAFWPGNPYRQFLDMRKPEVRKWVVYTAILRAKILGADFVAFDNCYWCLPMPGFPVPEAEWRQAFIDFAKEAREQRFPFVMNVAAVVTDVPAMLNGYGRTEGLGQISDGICYENPLHPKADRIKELAAWRQFVSRGKLALLFIPKARYAEVAKLLQPIADEFNGKMPWGGIYCVGY
jgi:hypothetical protein